MHLRVTDTGPGVPESLERHLFTPFFTTKEPGHGTGLGLSISYSIVESHGGHISYERAPGGGASFRIDLPRARRAHRRHSRPRDGTTCDAAAPVVRQARDSAGRR